MDLDALAPVLEPLARIPVATVFLISVVVIVWVVLHFNARKAKMRADEKTSEEKNHRASKLTAALEGVTDAIGKIKADSALNSLNTNNALSNINQSIAQSTATMQSLSDTIASLRDSQDEVADAVKGLLAVHRGAISAEDSRRLVFREMESLRKEVFYAVCASLRQNHYKANPKAVISKLGNGLQEQFDKTAKILNSYTLSLSTNEVLTAYSVDSPLGPTVKYRLVDLICEGAVPFYMEEADYEDEEIARRQDIRTSEMVKRLFRQAFKNGIDSALSAYTRDPVSGHHPITRQSGASWSGTPEEEASDTHKAATGIYRRK